MPEPYGPNRWRPAPQTPSGVRRLPAARSPAVLGAPPDGTCAQLHPLVVPQDSQTKQEPAGRMRTPQVEQ